MSLIAPTLQLFFAERLLKQRQASPATVRSYRNALTLLLRFVQKRTGKAPSSLEWHDLGVETISAFLGSLETDRHNSARSRNARLAALRSLFRYAALRHPEHAQVGVANGGREHALAAHALGRRESRCADRLITRGDKQTGLGAELPGAQGEGANPSLRNRRTALD